MRTDYPPSLKKLFLQVSKNQKKIGYSQFFEFLWIKASEYLGRTKFLTYVEERYIMFLHSEDPG